MIAVASGELSRAVLQAQLGMALASLRPPRPNPAPGARTVSGVRVSAAPAQPATAIEGPLVGEGLQVVKCAPIATRCRHRHALAIEPVVLSADSQPLSLLRHGGSPYPRCEAPYRPASADNMPAGALLAAANLNIAPRPPGGSGYAAR